MSLNEPQLRRPDFSEGRQVVLADGQSWTLPRVAQFFYPVADDERGYSVGFDVPGDDRDPPYTALIDGLDAGTKLADQIRAEMALGRRLLLRNYDLDEGQVGTLLRFAYDRAGNPEGAAVRERVMAVALCLPDPDELPEDESAAAPDDALQDVEAR